MVRTAVSQSNLGIIYGQSILLTASGANGVYVGPAEVAGGAIYHTSELNLYLGANPAPGTYNNVIIPATTESAAIDSGALVIAGGIGIAKNITAGANVSILGATDSTTVGTGSLIVAGGVGVAKNITVGVNAKVLGATVSSSTVTGALVVTGGVGVGGAMFVGGALTAASFVSSTAMASVDLAIDADNSCLPAGNITVQIRKSAGIVSFKLTKIEGTTESSKKIITSGALDAAYHPDAAIDVPCTLIQDGIYSIGSVVINANGTIEIYQTGHTTFTTGLAIQVLSISTSWPVA